MDRVAGARQLINELVKAEHLEVRRAEIVGRDLAAFVETLKQPPTGQEVGEWLEEHRQVTEVSASTAVLDELVDRYLRDPETAASVTAAREPDLERELRADPTNSAPYLVYADWLQEHSDPLGELIALSVASDSGDDNDVGRFERHLKRHHAYFLGEAAGELATRVRLSWRYGFVQRIEALGDLGPEVWQQLLRSRVCELVESITLLRPCSETVDAMIALAAPGSMRELTLEAIEGHLPVQLMRRPLTSLTVRASPTFTVGPDTFPGSLDRLDLHVFRVEAATPFELPVRELSILTTDANLEFLGHITLPRIERLSLSLMGAAGPAIAAVEAMSAPTLRHLALHGGTLEPAVFRRLAELPLASRLHSLGLVNLGLTDDTIAPLVETRGFSALEQLDVSLNELTRTGLDALRALAPNVISTRQRRRGFTAEKRVRAFAGSRLQPAEDIADPRDWKRAGIDGDIRWGRYRGEADYELFVAADLSRYGCSCPSSIQPCKHVVALALVAERTPLRDAPSNGIETRVTTRAGLDALLLASIDGSSIDLDEG